MQVQVYIFIVNKAGQFYSPNRFQYYPRSYKAPKWSTGIALQFRKVFFPAAEVVGAARVKEEGCCKVYVYIGRYKVNGFYAV